MPDTLIQLKVYKKSSKNDIIIHRYKFIINRGARLIWGICFPI